MPTTEKWHIWLFILIIQKYYTENKISYKLTSLYEKRFYNTIPDMRYMSIYRTKKIYFFYF